MKTKEQSKAEKRRIEQERDIILMLIVKVKQRHRKVINNLNTLERRLFHYNLKKLKKIRKEVSLLLE